MYNHRPMEEKMQRIVVFARQPVIGKVKTRLASEIGDEAAVRVYKVLLEHTLIEVEGFSSRLMLAEATDNHPAQAQSYSEDEKNGTRRTVLHSGMLSPVEKRNRLHRLDKLTQAVKQARQRANRVDIVDLKVADTIFGYIEGDD